MPKYKNISDFRQSIVIQGKRALLVTNDVFESSREHHEPFLERVPDDTPVTVQVSDGRYVRYVDKLVEQVAKLEEEKENINAVNTEKTLCEVKDFFNEVKEQIKSDMDNMRENIKALRDMYTSQRNSLDELKKSHDDHVETSNRRLGILKSAMMTMEEEIFGPSEIDEGN